MRVSTQSFTNNFLADLGLVQRQLARLQHQAATGKAFDRPRDNPAGVAVSLNLKSAITYLAQYNRNVDDGASRLSYAETAISDVQAQLQRVRELTVQGANSYLTRGDRSAIATEVNQLTEQIISLGNSNFRGRYIFSGFETLTETFGKLVETQDGLTSNVSFAGDAGVIDRNIGIQNELAANLIGKNVFMEQTYTLKGRQLSTSPLGYLGSFELNDRIFSVGPTMTLDQVRDMVNSAAGLGVQASITSDLRLQLTSLTSSGPVKVKDISGTVLEDLGILPEGAFNLGQKAPTLPLTDSRGAIHASTALVFPLGLTTATQDLVVELGGAANNGATERYALKLDAITYATSADLVAEIQKKADLAFGQDKIRVVDAEAGVIELESFVQSGAVSVSDLRIGGTAPDGTVDSASTVLGFNALPGVQELADTAGVDGNDRFVIDLGLTAYRNLPGEVPLDLPPIEINIDASVAITLTDLVKNINDKILTNQYLTGLVEAKEIGGRVQIATTKKGKEVLGTDMVLSNAVAGPVAPLTDTLDALGFYRDALTGISAPPVPATVFSTAAYPPGIGAIALGVNDQFSITLGAQSSLDGIYPAPQTLTLTPGAYATSAALAAEINTRISLNPVLKNAVVAVVRTVGATDFVDIQTVSTGSRVQPEDLTLTDVVAGTLANLGLSAPTTPGGGTASGQGDITLPHNMLDTLIKLRDELFGYAAPESRLTDLLDENGASLGLFPGGKIRITSDGSSQDFVVQRFSTLQDLADNIESKLGFQLEVRVLRDGRLEIFNPTTTTVANIQLQGFDVQGNAVPAFDAKFTGIGGNLTFRGRLQSEQVYEDERFQQLTRRLGDMDDALERALSALSELGSRQKRLSLTSSQNETVTLNLQELQTSNDFVDMAETLTRLQEQENVLRAALSTGSRVLLPSLFDFLR